MNKNIDGVNVKYVLLNNVMLNFLFHHSVKLQQTDGCFRTNKLNVFRCELI